QINIRNSFDAFNNYGQTFIMNDQLKGVGSAELNIESYWTPNFVLDKERLKINSHLIIEKGELIDFKPLEKLSSYVSLDELKHVKFSTLENTIDVANKVVTIPAMEIKSSALSVFLSGTHTFNQEINYEVTLLLSELLSSSFRKTNTQITEFGEEQQDGEIFNTVYFKMTGNTDKPKISLNKIRFMEDVNNSIEKEKEIINNIIKEDILQTEEREEEEKGQEIEIEWDPEL
ncbi:MAG: AsmA-like C-terminal region-containing protein, partial [Bacteroidota bacterium]|nr:AsmA-like C-terminal region-containing protein [Bacteroidota bacterium]